MNKPIIECVELSKSYQDAKKTINVLNHINLTIHTEELLAVVGPSGSGKSTLLHLLGGLDKPTSGKILANGNDWQTLSENERCRLRNQDFGFVYQFHHLLPEFTALENVAMPLLLAKTSWSEAMRQSKIMLEEVELGLRLNHKPSQLSGGERQRVAIARALVHTPKCVFADEPTGNLDQVTANHVFELMLHLNQKLGTALVIVTHDSNLATRMKKIITLKQGYLSDSEFEC